MTERTVIPNVKTKQDRARFYGSASWKQLRQSVLERDNFECQWCKELGKVTNQAKAILEVDHIKELEDYPEHALDPNNLRTLCKECHNKRHKRFNFRPSERQKRWDDEWW